MFKLFTLADVEVSATPSYLLLVALCFLWYGVQMGIIAAIAISLSIIIHEFGHAVVCKRYKLSPYIVLHGLGGLCYHNPAGSDKRDALISVMGPVVQILAGALALGVYVFGFASISTFLGSLSGGAPDVIGGFVSIFAGFSIFWGLINLLLPLWPLDGGKLFGLLLRRFMNEDTAATWTLRISMALLIPIGIYALMSKSFLLGYIVLSLFIENYQLLSSGSRLYAQSSGRTARVKPSDFINELMTDARANFAEEDWREAARLCHQMRAAKDPIPAKMMNEIWQILGLATMEQGEYEEALEWLKRAPKNARVEAAIARCEEALRS